MIREIIRPQQTHLSIDIPESYIDKEIELIIFPINEKKTTSKEKQEGIATLGGCLNKYADLSKIDLEDKAWELHIMDKYK